ncbi:MAG: MBL fold metallo-hydrolase [Oscillospiraceae bacterium]|nr:MBL fold metallo-hydrolase [Oscillospiraceae bacterium]
MSKRRRRRTRNRGCRAFIVFLIIAALGAVGYFITQSGSSLPVVLQDNEVAVHFIDVGQGDATLIQTGQGSMLIDGGDNHMRERVVQYLRDAGIERLDYVVATHPHADHIGGLIGVFDAFQIGQILMPNITHTTETFRHFINAIERNGALVREPIAGEVIMLGNAQFTVIAPNSSGYANLNDYSIGLRLVVGTTSFVFTGDAEALSEQEMIDAGHVLNSDVLRVGHHGSHTSTAQEFFAAVSPAIAVISVGADNRYGHPHRAVRERLEDITVYRTDRHGHIVMVTDGTYITVTTGSGNGWLQQVTQWFTQLIG